jgi:hypothetical protein
LIILAVLAACVPAVPVSTADAGATAAAIATQLQPPTATEPPAPTATEQPSATETPTATQEPTATQPPTATPVPPLAVLEDGFSAWCAPQEYAGMTVTAPDAPAYANLLKVSGSAMQVKIPAAYCTFAVRFNQPAPAGASLVIFDGSSAFLSRPLDISAQPDVAWTTVSHDYVINPPLWEISYRVAILGPDGKELWSNPIKFAKPLPVPCPYGGLPDPVTLYCTITDPKEIEPHADITWPANYTRVP